MLSCGPLDRKDTDPFWKRKRIAERKLFIPDKYRVQARTTKKEMTMIAQMFGEKLNRAKGNVAVFIPSKGFSSLGKEGGPLYEPETDAVFLRVMRKVCDRSRINLIPMDCNIDDPQFAEAIIEHFVEMMGR